MSKKLWYWRDFDGFLCDVSRPPNFSWINWKLDQFNIDIDVWVLCLENALGNKLPGNQLLFIKNFDNIKPSTQITHFALWVWLFCCFWSKLFFWKLCDIFKNSWGETKYCIFQNNLNSFLYIMMPILKDFATYYSGNICVWVIFWHVYLCPTNSLHSWVSQTFALLPWMKI